MFKFLYPKLLFLLVLIPFIIIFYIYAFKSKKKALEIFAKREILNKLISHLSIRNQIYKAILIILAISFLIIALARPQFGTRMEVVKRAGIDLFIVLDVSKSMLAEDISPNRLIRAKMEINKIIDNLKGDKIGIIIFAGIPFVQCPLTTDYAAAKMMLEIISPDLIPIQGTNVTDALKLAKKSFSNSKSKSKVIILITDGENHEGNIEKITKEMAKDQIKIFTVGIGSPTGVPIPVYDKNGNKIGLKKDRNGNIVTTKLNEEILQKIALLTNGKYLHASSGNAEIHKIFEEIKKMEKTEFQARKFSQYEERFYVPLGIGLLLILIEFFIPERRKIKGEWKGRFDT